MNRASSTADYTRKTGPDPGQQSGQQTDLTGQAIAGLERTAEAVREHGGAAVDAAVETSKHTYDSAHRFVREQPLLALAGAIAAGAAIGALLKSRQRQNTVLGQAQLYGEPYLKAVRNWRW